MTLPESAPFGNDPTRKSNAGCFYIIPALFAVSAICALVAAWLKYHH